MINWLIIWAFVRIAKMVNLVKYLCVMLPYIIMDRLSSVGLTEASATNSHKEDPCSSHVSCWSAIEQKQIRLNPQAKYVITFYIHINVSVKGEEHLSRAHYQTFSLIQWCGGREASIFTSWLRAAGWGGACGVRAWVVCVCACVRARVCVCRGPQDMDGLLKRRLEARAAAASMARAADSSEINSCFK